MDTSANFDLNAYLQLEAEDLWDTPEENTLETEGVEEFIAAANKPSPSSSLEGLLAALPQYRRLFLEVITYAEQPCEEDQLCALIDEWQQTSRSVYTPQTLCGLLERAGALKRVDAEGNPFTPESAQPETVEVDEQTYLVPTEPDCGLLASTEEALAWVNSDDPLGRFQQLLEENASLSTVYLHILEACDSEDGIAMSDLNTSVNALPEVLAQKLRAGAFVDHLEKCDTITWNKTWHTTDIGKAALAQLKLSA